MISQPIFYLCQQVQSLTLPGLQITFGHVIIIALYFAETAIYFAASERTVGKDET